MRVIKCFVAVGLTVLCSLNAAQAQDRLNRTNPDVIERALPQPTTIVRAPEATILTAVDRVEPDAKLTIRVASAIVVEGAPEMPRYRFSEALVPYIGQNLSTSTLGTLSHDVAEVARRLGYPFARARIEPQSMANGVLRVQLDAGTLSAVRVIGHANALADTILTRMLVTGQPVRRERLERAIMLVGDIPGVTVKESRYVNQDGFGILLVTVSEDRFSAYAQIDNRGSKEVGPVRSTVIANMRGMLALGDEASIILANTPLDPSEFVFVRGRYTAPVDANGAVVSASASYGLARPGATLKPLDVNGESLDFSALYSKPIIRSRTGSLWGTLEFQGGRSNQSLLGSPLRHDRVATLTASLNGSLRAGSTLMHGEVRITDGLPLPGVTKEGDARISRIDGDARFVTLSYTAEWTVPLLNRVSLVLSSEGQVASRPLLATMEIGVGGPSYGRGYDYAERTGDDGILGSGELRLDLGRIVPKLIDRLQVYGAVDGGYVGNLRGGKGGGALLSTAAGVRLGFGRLSGSLEVALPLNEDRFDTHNHNPRVSSRLTRVF